LKPEGEIMSSLGRVLVVDDEPHVALTLHDVLVSCGYHVRVAATGQEALSLLSTFEPDMIFLDLGLPGMRGEAVLEQLVRERPDVPVVIVSGNTDTERARATLARGAFDYIAKPFQVDVLERVAAAALARRGRL
jgi:DNA-binding response OmpR family regulator